MTPRAVWCPEAESRPLAENRTQPLKDTPNHLPLATIDHTQVDAPGPMRLYEFFARSDVGAESTYGVSRSGYAEQYMSCDVVANAQRRADGWADSLETEDDGDPERWEWTDPQMEKMCDIHVWECLHLGVSPQPAVGAVLPAARGQGYHSMWRATSQELAWTMYRGKTCPGSRRIAQWWGELLPEIQRRVAAAAPQGPQDWSDMASKQEIADLLTEQLRPVLELVGAVKAEQARFEEDTRILLEGCTVRVKGDNRQYVIAHTPSGLAKIHVPDAATLALLRAAREVGKSDQWNLVEVDGDAARALEALPEAG